MSVTVESREPTRRRVESSQPKNHEVNDADVDKSSLFLEPNEDESLVQSLHKRKLVNTDKEPATLTQHNESCQSLVRETHTQD